MTLPLNCEFLPATVDELLIKTIDNQAITAAAVILRDLELGTLKKIDSKDRSPRFDSVLFNLIN